MLKGAAVTADMGQEPIGKLIWKMSVPSVVGVLAYNVYNLFDTIFVARWAGMDGLRNKRI